MFPVDDATLDYLELTGRDDDHIELTKEYLEAQGLFGEHDPEVHRGSRVLDLSSVEPSLAGHKKPHARIPDGRPRRALPLTLLAEEGVIDSGAAEGTADSSPRTNPARREDPRHARGRHRGRDRPRFGPRQRDHVLYEHLEPVGDGRRGPTRTQRARAGPRRARLRQDQSRTREPGRHGVPEAGRPARRPRGGLGYNVVGYGCTTCIRTLAPLADPIEAAIDEHDLWTTSVLSATATSKPASIRRSARTTSPVRRLSSPTVWRARWTSTSRTNRSARTTTAKTSSRGRLAGPTGGQGDDPRERLRRVVQRQVRERLRGRRALGRPSTRPRAKSTTGTTSRRTSASHRSSRTSRSRNPASRHRGMRAVCSRSATP